MFIARICNLFGENHIPFAVVGGYAVAMHGVARGTFDVDIITIISEENLKKVETVLGSIGMRPILPVSAGDLFANLEKYKRERNLVAWNFMHPTRMRDSLDIVITEDMRNFEIIEVDSDFGKIPTLSLDSLIQMKSRVNRDQDLRDIAALKLLREQRK